MHQFVFERSVVDGSETNVCAEKNGAAIGGESLELVDAGLHHMGGCDWVGNDRGPERERGDERGMLGFETSQFVGCVSCSLWNGVREDVDATANRVVHTDSVLRVGEDRLALRMRDIDCCLHDSGVHVTTGLSPMNAPVRDFMPSRPIFQVNGEPFARLRQAWRFGELHLGRQINGWPSSGRCRRQGEFAGRKLRPLRRDGES